MWRIEGFECEVIYKVRVEPQLLGVQCRIPYTSHDHTLIARVKELFEKLYNRRMLIRLIGVKYTHLVGGGQQINLFEDSAEMINLYQAMDKMRFRFGEDKIHRAAALSFSLRGFNPFNGLSNSPVKRKAV